MKLQDKIASFNRELRTAVPAGKTKQILGHVIPLANGDLMETREGKGVALDNSVDYQLFHLATATRFGAPETPRGRTPKQDQKAQIVLIGYSIDQNFYDAVCDIMTRQGATLQRGEITPAAVKRVLTMRRDPMATNGGSDGRHVFALFYELPITVGGLVC